MAAIQDIKKDARWFREHSLPNDLSFAFVDDEISKEDLKDKEDDE